MPVINIDLEDGLSSVSLTISAEGAQRFMDFMAECQAIRDSEASHSSADAVDATAGYTRALERLAARFARHRLCMSYNDSYFGEPAGELKRIAVELNRLLPSEAFNEKTPVDKQAPAHKASCALTGDGRACPCQSATSAV